MVLCRTQQTWVSMSREQKKKKVTFYRLQNALGWVHDFNKEHPDTPTIKRDLFGPLDVPWVHDDESKIHVEQHHRFVWDERFLVRTMPCLVHEVILLFLTFTCRFNVKTCRTRNQRLQTRIKHGSPNG